MATSQTDQLLEHNQQYVSGTSVHNLMLSRPTTVGDASPGMSAAACRRS